MAFTAVLPVHHGHAAGANAACPWSRVLMAHLGNGASLCAAREGKSCATTMGFSAVDGLMMGTRTGSLDPGVMLYLLEQGWDHQRLQNLLYKQSGLLGVSGISADMRRLRADGQSCSAKGHCHVHPPGGAREWRPDCLHGRSGCAGLQRWHW
jgi:acetate kinase